MVYTYIYSEELQDTCSIRVRFLFVAAYKHTWVFMPLHMAPRSDEFAQREVVARSPLFHFTYYLLPITYP